MPYLRKKLPLSTLVMLATGLMAGSANAVIEEVIVTANKRAESINDVGLSISAVTGEEMAERKLTSLEDISTVVPGLVYASSTANTPIFTLRGVGFNEQSLGAYPATSLYLDEAPMPFPVLASHSSYDLERVEVMKGPQGILFGQNSTGGAINFIPAKPTEEFAAGGDISYGRFNDKEFNGFVSGPLTDKLAARVAMTSRDADDWQQSSSSDRENGETRYSAGRLIMELRPSDTSLLSFNLNGWNDKSDPQAQQYIAANPQIKIDPVLGTAPATMAPILAAPFSAEDPRAADWSAANAPASDRDFYQMVLRGDVDISDSVTFTALGTHMDFEQSQVTDGDGSPLVLFDLDKSDGKIKSSIFEARLAGTGDLVTWVAGANYEKSETEEDQNLRYVDSTNYTASQGYINSSGIFLRQEITSYAFFGNAEIALNDRTRLKLGSRYTESENQSYSCNYATGDGHVADFFNYLGSVLGGGTAFTPVGVGADECYTLNYDNVPGEPFEPELSEDNLSWRAGIDYDMTDSTMIYTNISKGYKSGSFPSLAAATYTQLEPVVQESVLAYEIGVKTTLTPSLHVNAAAFYYDYKEKQVRGKVADPIFGILDTLVNVPTSKIQGVEADINYQITDELTVTGALTYLNSEVEEYTGINALGETRDFAGSDIPFTPELTYSLGLNYSKTLSAGGTFFSAINIVGQSDSSAVFDGDSLSYPADLQARGARSITPNFYVIEDYTTVDARIGFETGDEQWKIMLWGKNITNEYYYTNLITSSDTVARFAGRPATYGITVGYQF